MRAASTSHLGSEASKPTVLEELNSVNNYISLGMDPSPVMPSHEIPALTGTLIMAS